MDTTLSFGKIVEPYGISVINYVIFQCLRTLNASLTGMIHVLYSCNIANDLGLADLHFNSKNKCVKKCPK